MSNAVVGSFINVWDQGVRDLWPKDYAQQLSQFLHQQGCVRVLDSSGGTGYPSIDLKQMGWDVSYSDISTEMLDFFTQKTNEQQLDIPCYLSSWEALPDNIPDTYDGILCRGNSLIYLSNIEFSHDLLAERLVRSFQGMFHQLNKGGLIYFDLPNPAHAKPAQSYQYEYSTDRIATIVSYDPVRNIRSTKNIQKHSDGSESATNFHAYSLDIEMVLSSLFDSGFAKIEKSPIAEASYVDAYIAWKL